MKLLVLTSCAVIAAGLPLVLSADLAYSPRGIIGLGDTPHESEYLFGYSGGNPNTLSLNGGAVLLSTATNPFDPGNNQGWWSATYSNTDDNDNYFVGDLSANRTQLINNFFTFDISGLTDPVDSAVLQLQRYSGITDTVALEHQYTLFDVSTDVSTLNFNGGTSAAIFNDLTSGVQYGQFVISVAGLAADIVELTLNPDALADLNSAIANRAGWFSVGGSLYPGLSSPTAISDTGSTLVLLSGGLGLLSFAGRRSSV